MGNFSLIYILAIFFASASAWRTFFRGRAEYGNLAFLGESEVHNVEELWFNQSLDHFDTTNLKRWEQRYFVNDSFFDRENGPIFLMIGGESEADPRWLVNGTMMVYAEKYKALCLLLEHRYYGHSRPMGDISSESLIYLNSAQALADTASFILSYNEKLRRNAKWVVFGGSYAGSLAAWMRLKYPHLVLGAVSSSGPLMAVMDFKSYYEAVYEALANNSQECVDAIIEGTKRITKLISHSAGQESLDKLFELCEPICVGKPNDVSNFYEILASNFALIVQYNKDNRYSNTVEFNLNIDLVCSIMTNKSAGEEVDRLAIINSLILQRSKKECLNFNYKDLMGLLKCTDWSSKAATGMRQWLYQTCTEFGFFQTSSSNKTQMMFGHLFPVELFEVECMDIFGEKFNFPLLREGIRRTNMIYGGLDIKVENVVFVHGSIDPWHKLGITNSLSDKAPAIYIPGTAHCANLFPSSPDDSPELIAARKEIGRIIEKWLNE